MLPNQATNFINLNLIWSTNRHICQVYFLLITKNNTHSIGLAKLIVNHTFYFLLKNKSQVLVFIKQHTSWYVITQKGCK